MPTAKHFLRILSLILLTCFSFIQKAQSLDKIAFIGRYSDGISHIYTINEDGTGDVEQLTFDSGSQVTVPDRASLYLFTFQ